MEMLLAISVRAASADFASAFKFFEVESNSVIADGVTTVNFAHVAGTGSGRCRHRLDDWIANQKQHLIFYRPSRPFDQDNLSQGAGQSFGESKRQEIEPKCSLCV